MLIIVEYCQYGNLQNHVAKSRNRFINQVDSHGNLSRLNHNSTTTESAQSDNDNYFVVACASSSIGKPNGEYENGPPSDAASKRIQHKEEANQSDLQQNQINDKICHQVIEMNRERITSDINQTITIKTELNREEIGLDFDPQECSDWSMKYEAADQQTSDEVLMGDNVISISTRDLICWSFQIARGMNFLASKKVLLREQNSHHSPVDELILKILQNKIRFYTAIWPLETSF